MVDAELGLLQRWMLSAVTTPGGVREGIRVARDAYALDIGDAVKDSNRLSAPARLEIYARGYVLRLLECLRAEFPILLALVGDQVFEMFASSYVWSAVAVTNRCTRSARDFRTFCSRRGPIPAARRARSRRSPPISPRWSAPAPKSIGRAASKTIPRITPPMRSR